MRLVTCIFLLFLTQNYSFAQGSLQGKITDKNGEVIIGVKVATFEDKSIITRTDLDGLFTLKFPSSSNYTISITYIGYDTITESIKLINNQVITKNYNLIEYNSIKNLAEVKIVAKQKKSNDYFMDKLKVNSATTIDFISSETMKKTGDQNVTAAITRVSGVSTNGGLITVRGIGDRYVKTTLNGSRIPTLDPLTNNIKLDIFPTSLIDNIVITKTASPELPGDWAGAYISVETKDYPGKFTLTAETQVGYNSQNTFKDIITSDRSSTDWLGFDDGFRRHNIGSLKSPNLAPSQYQELAALGLGDYFSQIGINSWLDGNPNGNLYFRMGLVQLGLLSSGQINDNASYQQALQLYNSSYKPQAFSILNPNGTDYNNGFNNNWSTKIRKAPLNFSNSFSIGDQKLFFGKELGYIVGLRYGSSIRYDPNGISQRIGFESQGFPFETQDYAEISRETNSWSALCNLALKINENNKLSFLFMPNFTGTNDVVKFQTIPDDGTLDIVVRQNIFYEQRKQMVYQIASQNYLPKSKVKIDFNSSFTSGNSIAPDFKATEYSYDAVNDSVSSYQFSPTAGDGIRRFDRFLIENILDTRLSAELPILNNASKLARKIKFGIASQRNFKKTDNYETRVAKGNNLQDPILTSSDLSSFLSQDRFVMQNGTIDFVYQNFDFPFLHSFGNCNINAAFALIDYEFFKSFRFSGGLRVEQTDIFTDIDKYNELGYGRNDIRRENVGGYPLINATAIKQVDFLPSTSFIYKIKSEKFGETNFRFNYSKTIARPSLRELNDAAFYDNEFRNNIYGNSDLKIVQIANYDFRIETFFKNGDNVSLSLFYKDLKNHIEAGFGSAGVTWNNVESSSVRGLEIEAKKKITKNFEIKLNYTYVKSISEFVRKDFFITPEGFKEYTIVDTVYRPMFGQAPYLINSIVSYTSDSLGFTATLSYNIQGPRLVIGGLVKENADVYELPRNIIDFKITKTLGKHFSTSLTVRDILNTPFRRSYLVNLPNNKWVDFDNFRYGTNFVLGISYKL